MRDELDKRRIHELFLWVLRRRRRFRVSGNSMLPLLKPGEEVLVNPNAYRRTLPRPGHIVVAQHPYRQDVRLIKRIAAVSEDGRCLLTGDNPIESTDSRVFGAVTVEQIIGRVTGRF